MLGLILVFIIFIAAVIVVRRSRQSSLLSKQNSSVDSIDCFDTLLFRYHGTPHDLYSHLEALMNIPGFAKRRVMAGILAWRPHRSFTLESIYDGLANMQGWDKHRAQQVRECEEAIDRKYLYPVKPNLVHVDSQRTTVTSDTFYSAKQLSELLIESGIHVKNVLVSDSGKATTRIWHRHPAKEHLGDNAWSDVVSPLTRGVRGFYTSVAKKNAQEKFVQEAGFPNLANNMRWLRLTGNPYSLNDVRHELFNEQIRFNVPLLFWSCLAIDNLCKSHGFNKLMFITRDCCHLKRVFDFLYAERGYTTDTFHCSRRVLEKAPEQYIEYVKSMHVQDKTLYVDINGTGYSLTAFFKKHMDGEKPNMFLTVWHTGMNVLSAVKVFPTGQLLKQGISVFNILNATKIEMLNYDLMGTLVDWDNGPVRAPIAYDRELILPYHRAIEYMISVRTPMLSEGSVPTETTVRHLIKSFILFGKLPKLMKHDEALWGMMARAGQIGSRAYFQK